MGPKLSPELRHLTRSSREDLTTTLAQVQEVHSAIMANRPVKRGVVLGALDYLKQIEM